MSEPVTLKTKKKERLSKDEAHGDQIRFFSQFNLDGEAIQKQLEHSKVIVFGAGAIGSHTVGALAEAGVGTIRVVDEADTDKRDVATSAYLRIADVGKARAEMAALHVNAKEIPSVKCEAVSVDLESETAIEDNVAGTNCALVCLDWPSPALLHAMNRSALRAKTPWISAHLSQGVGILGPAVIPGQTPCYGCYEMRRNANLENYEEVMLYESRLRQMPAIKREVAAPRPLAASLGGLLALDVLRLLTRKSTPQTAGRIMRFEFFAPEITYHRFLRLPNCTACGSRQRQS